jgi:hypothetical protein
VCVGPQRGGNGSLSVAVSYCIRTTETVKKKNN